MYESFFYLGDEFKYELEHFVWILFEHSLPEFVYESAREVEDVGSNVLSVAARDDGDGGLVTDQNVRG